MAANLKAISAEIRVVVDGEQFYSFARAMKRAFRAYSVGEVVIRVEDRTFTIKTNCSGAAFICNPTPPFTARLRPGNFNALVSLVKNAETKGPLEIWFRPNLGEVALKHIGVRAVFDKRDGILPN